RPTGRRTPRSRLAPNAMARRPTRTMMLVGAQPPKSSPLVASTPRIAPPPDLCRCRIVRHPPPVGMSSLRAMPDGGGGPDRSAETILVVGAHPDDIDFGACGTVATWTDAGARVVYCIVTDGDAGGFDA